MRSFITSLFIFSLLTFPPSCKEKDKEDQDNLNNYAVTIDPSVTFQEMTGFGGSLTWYSDRIISSPYKNQICKMLFEDMGTDIIRFKNNYYPAGYPAVKSAEVMENAGLKTLFNTTNQLYDLAKQYNPDIQTMISSWTPPSGLKSNSNLREGTLKKEGGLFMYEAFADYWYDVLDNITFNPDYISIQNEPSWITPDWETCEWRPVETADFPGYATAFDQVYNRISTRVNPPELIGPEAENIGVSKFGGNTFGAFSDPISDKPYLAMYGYHTYNFSATTPIEETKTLLNMVRDSYGNKPCIMTEYSNFTWLKTAQFILQNLNEANASGYIYWLMAWSDTNEQAMIKIGNSGNYSATPFYYVMKHFAKFIDKGYIRVSATMTVSSISLSAFIDTSEDKITVVMVNTASVGAKVSFDVINNTVKTITAVQSEKDNFYKELGSVAPDGYIILKPSSVTTVVLDI
jgi:O-glycosyl hydrolase